MKSSKISSKVQEFFQISLFIRDDFEICTSFIRGYFRIFFRNTLRFYFSEKKFLAFSWRHSWENSWEKKTFKTYFRKSHKIKGGISVECLEKISGAIVEGIFREIFSRNFWESYWLNFRNCFVQKSWRMSQGSRWMYHWIKSWRS